MTLKINKALAVSQFVSEKEGWKRAYQGHQLGRDANHHVFSGMRTQPTSTRSADTHDVGIKGHHGHHGRWILAPDPPESYTLPAGYGGRGYTILLRAVESAVHEGAGLCPNYRRHTREARNVDDPHSL